MNLLLFSSIYFQNLVHNWAQFKYGVFTEYSNRDLENSRQFYINSNGNIEATRCSSELTGSVINPTKKKNEVCNLFENGLPSADCTFSDDIKPNDPLISIGSLLYKPFLTQVTTTTTK